MFDLFRSRTKVVRYMLGAVLLLVAFMLVVTLVPGIGVTPTTDPMVVAEIGDEVLSLYDVQQNLNAQLRSRNIPASLASTLVPQLVERLIEEYALAYQAERLGFRVTDADVAAAVQRMLPELFQGGKFAGREVYARVLAERNLTIPQFEQMVRKQLLIEKIQALAEASVILTDKDIEQEYRRRFERVKIEYVLIDPGKILSSIKIDSDEIRQHFERNRASYVVPEKRSMNILVVDEQKVAAETAVSEAELRKVYEQERDSFRVPERVRVRHILLKTTDKPKEEVAKIRQKAEQLLKQLKQGANFAELARKHSEDPGSAEKGGELDWIVRGQTVKNFEDTAFSLKPGQLSEIITTEYGFHILQVLEKQEARLRPFEEVRPQILEELKQQRVRDTVERLADQARAELVRNPQAAEQIAAKLGLKLIRAEKVSEEDPLPELGEVPALQQTAALLRRNEVTPVVQIAPTRYAVAVVTEVFPSHQAELSEVQSKVMQEILSQKLRQAAEEKAKEALARAREFNGDLKKVAQIMMLDYKAPGEFTREMAVEGLGPATYVEEAFRLPVGALFGPVNVNERRFVCKVTARIPADISQLPQQREAIVERLRAERVQQQMELLQRSIREQLAREKKLKINQDVVNRLVSSFAGV